MNTAIIPARLATSNYHLTLSPGTYTQLYSGIDAQIAAQVGQWDADFDAAVATSNGGISDLGNLDSWISQIPDTSQTFESSIPYWILVNLASYVALEQSLLDAITSLAAAGAALGALDQIIPLINDALVIAENFAFDLVYNGLGGRGVVEQPPPTGGGDGIDIPFEPWDLGF